ncbi:beta-ketoacyl-[acyl-carrier-protein] synthase family protein [Pseudomonadota bacterium]
MHLAIPHYTATSAVGEGLQALGASIVNRSSGLRRNDFECCDINTWIGRAPGISSVHLPPELRHLDSRNNRLAWLGLQQDGMLEFVQQIVSMVGAERIGVIMGTSTSSIGDIERAYRNLDKDGRMRPQDQKPEVQNMHAAGIFVAAATGLKGPCMTISTACSSSAKVFASAARWIDCGFVDATLIGGVDSLCLNTLYGFNSLELVSPEPCRPSDRDRRGISIGEAAGYAVVCRPDLLRGKHPLLLGYGESSDAFHMSHPHPEGKGALSAIDQALARAKLDADDIGYVNLHGTASKANDAVENKALAARFNNETLCSSTKGWTGHTLGAAGMLEAVITLEVIRTGVVPGTLNCENVDPAFGFPVLQENTTASLRYALSNSFGFGGNNASLVFGACDD